MLIDQAPPPDREPEGGTIHVQLRGPAVPRALAWRLVGDTDWMARRGGSGKVLEMGIQPGADGLPVIAGELAGPAGMRMPFQEVWTSWASGQYFRQVRDVDHPLLRRTDYHARLKPAGDGLVEPEIHLQVTVPRALKGPLALFQVNRIGHRWEQALAELARAEQPPTMPGLPSAAEVAFSRWEKRSDPGITRSFGEYFRTARPTDLRRIRGFALADQWGMDRDAVVEAMLQGVDCGALELYWSVRCTRCYGQVASADTLSDLADHARCDACRIDLAADLGSNVEVLFAPHRAVLPRSQERFCTLYPAGSPELHGVFTLAPGQQLQQSLSLAPGEWRLGPGGDAPDMRILAASSGGDARVSWRMGASAGEQRLAAGPVQLDLANDSDKRARVYLVREGGLDDRIPASYLTANPAFRRRIGHQVLAPNLRISAGSMAILFTDLSGSTAMYEQVGDAGAFALVRDHFDLLRGVVEDSGGVVVKTIGDAVMAAFYDAEVAFRCALAMQAAFNPWVEGKGLEQPLRLKVGLHQGPVLAVHTDASGLDYFGGTVNTAARAQGVADGGDVVWTSELQEDPRIVRILREGGLQPEPLQRKLKGLSGEIRLYRISTLSRAH